MVAVVIALTQLERLQAFVLVAVDHLWLSRFGLGLLSYRLNMGGLQVAYPGFPSLRGF